MAETTAPAVGQIGWIDLTVPDAERVAHSTNTSPAGPPRRSAWVTTTTTA